MTVQSPSPYLLPREIVTRTELAPGIGAVEALVILAGAGAGFVLQLVPALIGHLVPAGAHSAHDALLLARGLLGLGCVGSAYMATRPTPGGSVADYVRAMRRWARGTKVYLYGGDVR